MSISDGIGHNRTDYVSAFGVWCVYATAETLLLPAFAPEDWHVDLDAQSVFVLFYQTAFAFVIAFPLADAKLPRHQYVAFTTLALGLLAASSIILEFAIDPLLFGSSAIPAAGYLRMVEGGVIVILLTIVRLLAHRRRNERRLAELQKANTEAELQYLKGQINPHVLFNALNNIYSHALHKSDETPELILKLADMLRYMIYDCAGDEVALEREVAFLSDYVDVQKLALDGRGVVSFECDGALEGKKIAPFLLIPFVENCFKHSLDTQVDSIGIDINLRTKDGRLHLNCSNTFDPDARKTHDNATIGIGLTNVRRRLQLLFGEDFILETAPSDVTFHASLQVPVRA
ncbi:MAG: histidine kinase [Pseudomonadota bacterium]